MSFATEFLRTMYQGCDVLHHLATFNKFAYWKQMAAYGSPADAGGLDWVERANDYSPEPDE